jgi:MFS family permease
MTHEVDQYLQIKAEIELAYNNVVKEKRRQGKTGLAQKTALRVYWFGIIAPPIFALLLAPIGIGQGRAWAFYVCVVLLAIAAIAFVCLLILLVWSNHDSLKRFKANPVGCQLEWNVKTVMHIDAQYLPRLIALPTDILKLGALELKSECSALEKRAHIVTGALEKVGIFPGALALLLGLAGVVKVLADAEIKISMMYWVMVVGAATIFYSMCGYAQMTRVRYERLIALTELAIERKSATERTTAS